MAKLTIAAHRADDSTWPEGEITAHQLIHAFAGNEEGAPVITAAFRLYTDDGHVVYFSASPDNYRRRSAAATLYAKVERTPGS